MSNKNAIHYQINEHVYAVDPYLRDSPGNAKIYLVSSDKQALIDLCTSYTVDHIVEGFKAVNHSVEDVDYLFITHHHYDHCGCISAMAPKMPQAEICSSLYASRVIENPEIRFLSTLFLYGQEFWHLSGDFKPLIGRDVRIVSEGDTFDLGHGVSIRVLELPGHEQGSLGFLEEKTKTLFVGDSLGIYRSGLYNPAAFKHCFTYDDQIRTLERVLSIDFDQICYSHTGCYDREQGKEIVRLGIKTFKYHREVITKAAQEEPSLEHIYERLLNSEAGYNKMWEAYPEGFRKNLVYGIILGFAYSLGIEVPAEATVNGWRTP